MPSVRVRMYRQGLGDSFLLTFFRPPKPRHVLVDCGVLLGTKDAEAKMKAVAEDVLRTTEGKLDVLVATHEHWDHLSGFVQAQDVFKRLEIDEIWLAWTEDPADALARELRKQKRRTLNALVHAASELDRFGDSLALETIGQVEAMLDFFGADRGAVAGASTESALRWIKERDATLRYLRPGERVTAFGGQVYVLGPPHDPAQIKRSDPSKSHPEVYELAGDRSSLGLLAAIDALGTEEAGRQPFARGYQLTDVEAKREPLLRECYDLPDLKWRTIDHDWLDAAGSLALKLDSDTNNTSLVLAFELAEKGPVLLFPGDAQVGNWLSWRSVDFPDAPGVNADDLLARTALYKVGHHASHNATLREAGLELMTSPDLAAMIPVNRAMAKKKRWNMPFPPLFDRLNEKTMGRLLDAEQGQVGDKAQDLAARAWQDFQDRTDIQKGWIDYTLNW